MYKCVDDEEGCHHLIHTFKALQVVESDAGGEIDNPVDGKKLRNRIHFVKVVVFFIVFVFVNVIVIVSFSHCSICNHSYGVLPL